MDIVKYMTQWMGEYFGEILQRERKRNQNYRKASETLVRCFNAVDDQNSSIDAYSDAIYDKHDIELDLLYAQGYRDCLALLRFLRML